MNIRTLSLAALVLCLPLAGCVDSGEPSAQPSSTASSPASYAYEMTLSRIPQPNDTSSPNAPPTASLSASADGGSAPIEILFSLDGTDPEGANVTWTLDFDHDGTSEENGTSLPTQVNHTFDNEGNYTVLLEVSDGELVANATVNVSIVLEAAVDQEPVVFEGSALAPDALYLAEGECLFPLLTWVGLPFGGVSGDVHSVPSTTIGWNYTLDSTDFVAMWLDSGGSYAGEGSSGVVPEGSVDVFVCSTGAVAADYTLTITPPGYVPPA